LALDALARAVGLHFLSNEQPAVAAARARDDAGDQRNAAGAEGRELAPLEPVEQPRQALGGERVAFRRERHAEAVEHPRAGGAVLTHERLLVGRAENPVADHESEQPLAGDLLRLGPEQLPRLKPTQRL